MDAASDPNPDTTSSQSFPSVSGPTPDDAGRSPYDGGRTPSDDGLATAGELTLAGEFTVTNDLLLDHSTGLLGKVDPESNRLVAQALETDPSLQTRLEELRRLVRILRAAIEVFDRRPLDAAGLACRDVLDEAVAASIPDAAARAIQSNAIAGITNAELIDHLMGDTSDTERQRVNVKLVESPELLARYRELERLLVVVDKHYEARLPAFGEAQDMALRRTIRDIVRALPQAVPLVAEDFKLPDLLDHSRGELEPESGVALENAMQDLPALADAMGEMASLASVIRERYQQDTPDLPAERELAMRDLIRESSRAMRAPQLAEEQANVDEPFAASIETPFEASAATPIEGVDLPLLRAVHAAEQAADDPSGETVTSLDIDAELRRDAEAKRRALAEADTDVLPPRLTVAARRAAADDIDNDNDADNERDERGSFPWSWAAVAAMLLAVAGVQMFLAGPRQAVPNGYAQPSALFSDDNGAPVANRAGGPANALVSGANVAANRAPGGNLANATHNGASDGSASNGNGSARDATVERDNTADDQDQPLSMPERPEAGHRIGQSSVYEMLAGGAAQGLDGEMMVDRNSNAPDGDGLQIDPLQLTPSPDGSANPYDATGSTGVAGFLAGDANEDGALDLRDYMLLLQALLNDTTDELGPAADVNGDKAVDLRDAMVLYDRLNP